MEMVMIKNKFIFIAFTSLLLATLACNSVLPQAEPTQPVISTLELPQGQDDDLPRTEAEVPRVTVNEAKAAYDSGAAIIVDVRAPEFYTDSHAAGAISIPLGLIESDAASLDLDKDKWIITYCT
jgi:3-mercaptopyruvate sulfurtransferase SseA